MQTNSSTMPLKVGENINPLIGQIIQAHTGLPELSLAEQRKVDVMGNFRSFRKYSARPEALEFLRRAMVADQELELMEGVK